MASTAERLTAAEILERVEQNADEELERRSSALAVSGLGAGMVMGLTGLGVASGLALLGTGPWERFAATMLYPIGFIAGTNLDAPVDGQEAYLRWLQSHPAPAPPQSTQTKTGSGVQRPAPVMGRTRRSPPRRSSRPRWA